jgi:outer membrane protein assembly factor BamE (lipoprotein component of BamABCDE complex)
MSNDGMTKEIQMTKDRSTKGPSRSVSSFVFRHSFVTRRSSFVIFAATRLVLVLLIALCVSCSGKHITRANVDQVAEGMSKKQVESILGPPTSINNEDFVIMKKTTYVYRQGKDTVTIVFKDDKVQAKDSTLAR